MPKHPLKKFLLSLVGAVVIALGITLLTKAQAATTFSYTLTELVGFSDKASVAYDINNSGQVVGYSYPATGTMHAVLWNNGKLTDLKKPGAIPYNDAPGINNAGQIVCNLNPGRGVGGRCTYLWQNGTVINIGLCDHTDTSSVTAINNAGQVAGFDVQRAFVWQSGFTYYQKTLGSTNSHSRALDINDRQQVVGYSSTDSGHQHAVLWQNQKVIDLGTLPGGTNSAALGINNFWKIVGWSNTSTGYKHAVLWQKRRITDLGTLDGNATTATAINDRGTVVGYSFAPSNGNSEIPLHAFVWRNGIMRNLNNLLPTNSGWELTAAYGINDRGQIVGSGKKDGQTKAFLLTPTLTTN
jgi:probable HAF family extracellular repeat protein